MDRLKLKMNTRHSPGFGIISALIGLGIVSGLAIVTAQTVANNANHQKGTSQSQEISNLIVHWTNELSTTGGSCRATFLPPHNTFTIETATTAPTPIPLPGLTLLGGSQIQAGTDLGHGLRLDSLELTALRRLNSTLPTYTGNLLFQFTKRAGETATTSHKSLPLYLNVSISGTQATIQDCSSRPAITESESLALCMAMRNPSNEPGQWLSSLATCQGPFGATTTPYVFGPWYVMAGSTLAVKGQSLDAAAGLLFGTPGTVFSAVGAPVNGKGTASGEGTGNLTYAATAGEGGVDWVNITLRSPSGGTLNGRVMIFVMTPYTWTGKVSADWGNPANWCGSVAPNRLSCLGAATLPSSTSTIRFDGTCLFGNRCNPTTDRNVDVAGVVIEANGFKQGGGNSLTVRTGGWKQTGGAFIGSDSPITIVGSAANVMDLSGGKFISTSGTLQLGFSKFAVMTVLKLGATADFLHNEGTLSFLGPHDWSCGHKIWTIDLAKPLVAKHLTAEVVDFCWSSTAGAVLQTSGSKVVMEGNFRHVAGSLKGRWELQGDLFVGTMAMGENAEIVLNGTGDQKLSAALTDPASVQNLIRGHTANVIIDKTSGTVIPADPITAFAARSLKLAQGTFTAPAKLYLGQARSEGYTVLDLAASGTANFLHNNGTVSFYGVADGSCNRKIWKINLAQDLLLNHAEVNLNDSCWNQSSGPSLDVTSVGGPYSITVGGNLDLAAGQFGSPSDSGANWNLKGNLSIGSASLRGKSTITFNGNTTQTYRFALGSIDPMSLGTPFYGGLIWGAGPNLVVNTTGQVEAASTDFATQSLKVEKGTFVAPTGTLYLGSTIGGPATILSQQVGAAFNHNNGILKFQSPSSGGCDTKVWSVNLNNTNLNLNSVILEALPNCGATTITVSPGSTLFYHNRTIIQGVPLGSWLAY
ncbi:MAG: hypothetical protein NDJ90_06115 [Oligoflexia bacterium]|nr:hypothetical protein [Oligoflexia bacterium]